MLVQHRTYQGIVVTAGLDDIAVIATDDAVLVVDIEHADEMPEHDARRSASDHKEVL